MVCSGVFPSLSRLRASLSISIHVCMCLLCHLPIIGSATLRLCFLRCPASARHAQCELPQECANPKARVVLCKRPHSKTCGPPNFLFFPAKLTKDSSFSWGPAAMDGTEEMKLEGAVVVVTGGASGLGASTVQACVARGAKVAAPRKCQGSVYWVVTGVMILTVSGDDQKVRKWGCFPLTHH